LKIFVNVVQAGSITMGAERSHRAVASISSRIKEMELEMGAPLLMRGRSGVVPTEAGRKLLEHGYRLLNDVQRMNDDLAEYGNRAKSFIKLCCNTVSLYEFLQKPISTYLRENPTTTLTIEELVNHQIPQAVIDGSADIGVVAEPVDTKGLETIPFALDRYVIISKKQTECLVGRRFVDFLDFDFVGPGRGSWMHTMLQQHAEEVRRPLKYSVQLRSFTMTCELVADGVGIGIVPASAAERMQKHLPLQITELEDSWAKLPLKFCVRKREELSQQSSSLLNFLCSQSTLPRPKSWSI
jgi:DNA-binding transcriptional LysR family regulator